MSCMLCAKRRVGYKKVMIVLLERVHISVSFSGVNMKETRARIGDLVCSAERNVFTIH